MKRLMESIVRNNVLANVILMILVALSVAAVFNVRREAMPDSAPDIVEVFVSYPGGAPQDVEENVTRRVEAALDGMTGIRSYRSSSWEGGSYVGIEAEDGCDPQALKDRVRNAVDSIVGFPAGIEQRSVSIDERTYPVLSIALSGDLTERQLKAWAEEIRSDLLRHPEISLVYVYNQRGYEITVTTTRERLRAYDLTLADIKEAIRRHSMDASCGTVETEGENIAIRAVARCRFGDDFEDIPVKASAKGDLVPLGRIAKIDDGFTEEPREGSLNGQPGLRVQVLKTEDEDALVIAEAIHEYVREARKELPPGVYMTEFSDDTAFLKGQLSMLIKNGILGMCIVVVVLWLFLTTRLSFWVALGIPISVGGALVYMWLAGVTVNTVTLFGILVVLGLVVDDAIVVGEAIYVHRASGKRPLQAAADGLSEVALPVSAAALTTVVAFLPLAFLPGDVGRMMSDMPMVAVVAILVSLFECLFLLPAHLNHLPSLTAPGQAEQTGKAWRRPKRMLTHGVESFAGRVYRPLVEGAVRRRYLSLCVGVAALLIAGGIFAGGWVKVIFWPPVDYPYFTSYVEFPAGTPDEVTREAIRRMAEGLERAASEQQTKSGDPFVRYVYTVLYSRESGGVHVEIVAPNDREISSQKFAAMWAEEVGQIPGTVAQNFSEYSLEKSTGHWSPIEVTFRGSSMDELLAAADKLKSHLRTYDGVYDVDDDFRPGKAEFQVSLKPEAAALGVTLEDVSRFLRAGYYGEEALRIPRGREDIRVRVRYAADERSSAAGLEQARIKTVSGARVPLLSVAHVKRVPGYSRIRGSNGMRSVTVWANTDLSRVTPEEVIAELTSGYLDGLVAGFADVSWGLSGAAESHRDTLRGLKSGLAIAVLAIFGIMVVLFRSYLQPLVIVSVVPFGIFGAVVGHLVMGLPLTLLSFFGIVALTGVVVNDAIVLTECVNGLIAAGTPFGEAVCQGGVRRFRAILLTTLTTCAGVTPVILEDNIQAQVLIPVAVSLAFGLVFATLVNFLLLPCFLAILNDGRRAVHRLVHSRWPEAEQVEPAKARA